MVGNKGKGKGRRSNITWVVRIPWEVIITWVRARDGLEE